MIQSRAQLREYLFEDNKIFEKYIKENFSSKMFLRLTCDHLYAIKKYIKLLRKSQYYYAQTKDNQIICKYLNVIIYTYYTLRKNILGNRLGFYIPASTEIGKGILIYHHGTLIINGNAVIGEYVSFHGNNCIGNKGVDKEAPVIGNGVEIGFGASVIGSIEIKNGTRIGAGSVVVHSTNDENKVLVGIPAIEK